MKKTALFLLLAFFSLALQAQTKRIAHRSHSGKNHTLLMNTGDNFGLPPKSRDTVKKAPVPVKKKTARKAARRKTEKVINHQ